MGIPRERLVVPYFVRTRTLVTLMCYQIISFFVLASCLIAPVSGHNTHTTDVVSHAPAPVPTSENAHSAPYPTPFSYESDILITDRQPHLIKTTSPKNPLSCKFGARCIFAHSPNELRSVPKRGFSFSQLKDADVIEPRVEPTRRAWRLTGEISADQVSAKTHKIAKGPDGSNGFDNSNSHGRRALLRLRSLHSQ